MDDHSAYNYPTMRREQQEASRPYAQAIQDMAHPEDYVQQQQHPEQSNEKVRNVRFTEENHNSNSKVPKLLQVFGGGPSVFRLVALEVQDKSREQELRRRDLILTFASLFGLFTMGLGAVVTWYSNPTRESGLDDAPAPDYYDLDPSPTGEIVCRALSIITSISTLISLVLIIRYYSLLLDKKRHEWNQEMVPWQRIPVLEHEKRKVYSFWQSSLSWYCYFELFIHLVHPMPFMDGTSQYVSIRQKTIYSYFQLWMLLRFYLVCRVLHTLHPGMSSHTFLRLNCHRWTICIRHFIYHVPQPTENALRSSTTTWSCSPPTSRSRGP